MKNRIALLLTHLLLLSSRLLAVCYFTVSYKWWVIVVFLFHGLVITTVDIICDHKEGGDCSFFRGISSVLNFFIHWLRDDIIVYSLFKDSKHLLWKRQLFSYCLYIYMKTSPSFFCFILANRHTHGTRYQSQSACVCSVFWAR